MGKTLNCIPHGAAGNNILLEYYTASANLIFRSFLIVIFFIIIFAFGGSPVSFQGGSNYPITHETPEVAEGRGGPTSTAETQSYRGPNERNSSCKIPATSIYQELLQ